jgi:hypothetical protein
VQNAIAMWNAQPFAPLVAQAREGDFVHFREAAAKRIKNQSSHAAPALAAYQVRLQLVHLRDTSNQLWHSIFDGTSRPNVQIENQSSSTSVGIAAYHNQLVMVHVGNGRTSLWHSVHTR